MNQSRALLIAAGYSSIIGLLLILVIGTAGLTLRSALLASIVLILLVPIGLWAIRGRLDIFEPIVLGNFALGVIFIGRPLSDLTTGQKIHLSYTI